MSNIYFTYLEGVEREDAIAQAETDLTLSKLRLMYETVCSQEATNIQEAELKVFKESGTYEDLQYLTEAATAEVAEKKQGIMTKIWEVIKSIFSGISNGLKKAFGKVPAGTQVDVPEEMEAKNKKLNEIWGHVKTVLSFLKTHKLQVGALITAIGGITAGITVLKAKSSGKTVKKPIEVVKGIADNISNKCNEVSSSISPSAGEGDDHGANSKLQELGNVLRGWKTQLISAIGGGAQAVSNMADGKSANGTVKNNAYTGNKNAHAVKNGIVTFTNKDGKFRKQPNGGWEQKLGTGKWNPISGIPKGFKGSGVATERTDEKLINVLGEEFIKECANDVVFYYSESVDEEGIDETVVAVEAGTTIFGVPITESSVEEDEEETTVEESVTEDSDLEALIAEMETL